jgi:hypothetical protein
LALLMVVGSALTPASGAQVNSVIAAHFADYSLPVPTPSAVIVCHGFGCQYRTEIRLGDTERRKLAEILATGKASPQAELKAVGQAVAWFDRLAGPVAGTESRVALADFRHYGDPHQFDCVDSSLNTTSVLAVLEQLNLLKHHHLAAPVARGHLINLRPPHATAVLIENGSGEKWSVDLWTRNYGEPPEIMPLARWLELDIWP